MKLYDLSHLLNNDSPVYPGTKKPWFEPAATIDKEGFRETKLCFESHLGTHIDAPAHMLENGKTLDEMALESFTGDALIISVPEGTTYIDREFLEQFSQALSSVEFVIFRTGWDKLWASSTYFDGFPVLSGEAVQWLLTFQLKGIGFDVISADPVDSRSWDNHMAILSKGLIIIENLVFPETLTASSGQFCCYPIPYEHADGSPVRAVFSI